MSEAITIIFIFAGVMAVTAIVFVLWIVVSLLRLIGRAILAVFGIDARPAAPAGPTHRCPRRGCQATNPWSARFCRRCGQELLKGQLNRRAAIW